MAIAVVTRSATTGGALSSATPAAALVAGNANILLINGRTASNDIASISDTAGNSYTFVAAFTDPTPNANHLNIYVCADCLGNASNVVTVTFNNSSSNHEVVALQVSGLDTTSPVIDTSSGDGFGTTWTAGLLEIGAESEAIAVAFVEADGQSIGAGAGGYTVSSVNLSGFFASAYRIVSADTTPTGSCGNGDWRIQAALFKAASGGGGVTGSPWYYYAQQ